MLTKTRIVSLAALVAGAGLLGNFALAPPASAGTPAINTVKVTPGGHRVQVSFNLTMKGFSGVEIGDKPLAPGHKTYAQQFGDFVNGSNGVPNAKTQKVTIDGLNQDTTYWATIQFQKGTSHYYKRNIAFTTKHRWVSVHVSTINIDGDGDRYSCGEDQAITLFNTVPITYPFGSGWFSQGWTAQKSVCHTGSLATPSDVSTPVGNTNNFSIATAAVDDDTIAGCKNTLSCGENAFAQTNVSTAPQPGGAETYTNYFSMSGYEGGYIGSVADSLGVVVTGSYSVWYA